MAYRNDNLMAQFLIAVAFAARGYPQVTVSWHHIP